MIRLPVSAIDWLSVFAGIALLLMPGYVTAQPAPPTPPTNNQQPKATPNSPLNSNSLDTMIEQLRQKLGQQKLSATNPQSNGQTNGDGKPSANRATALTAAQRSSMGDHVRRCWIKHDAVPDIDRPIITLTVTIDDGGSIRNAEVAGDDVARLSDPRFRAFAERAVRAVMDPHCAKLPMPAEALGKINVLTFRFVP